MKKDPQLMRLIWNYYRENKSESEHLQVLKKCKIKRRWGTFRVDCPSKKIANQVRDVIPLIELPIIKLRLAKRIKVFIQGQLFETCTIGSQTLSPADAKKFLSNY
ncbi:MAG: hypothetical protein ACLFRN_01120 [Halothece sp.]